MIHFRENLGPTLSVKSLKSNMCSLLCNNRRSFSLGHPSAIATYWYEYDRKESMYHAGEPRSYMILTGGISCTPLWTGEAKLSFNGICFLIPSHCPIHFCATPSQNSVNDIFCSSDLDHSEILTAPPFNPSFLPLDCILSRS